MLQQWLCHLARWTQQEALDFGATCYFFSLRGRLKSTWKLFKWNSCLSGCHSSWSFETDAFFEKKKINGDHRSVTLQGTELFGMPAVRGGLLPAPASCMLCNPCLGPGWPFKSCLRKVWEFGLFGVSFWNCSPEAWAVWKTGLQSTPCNLPCQERKLNSSFV